MTTKAVSTIYRFVEQAIANQVIEAVNSGFDVETAIGVQLDILGKYVGAERDVLGVSITSDFFDMNSYDNVASTAHGFPYYSENPTSNILFYTNYLVRTYRITDELLRSFIQFRASANKSITTLKECDNLMFEFFGSAVTVADNLDMSIDYTFTGSDGLLLFQILDASGSLPKPAGVAVNVNYV